MDNDVEEVAPQTQRNKIEFKQIPGISPINKFYEIKINFDILKVLQISSTAVWTLSDYFRWGGYPKVFYKASFPPVATTEMFF